MLRCVMASETDKAMLIYHDMRVHEDFERCAQRLFQMTQSSAKQFPGKRRILILDIQGHRNKAGGFDSDSYDILREFILGYLMPFLSEAQTPLYHVKNPRGQSEDIPEILQITDPERHTRTSLRDEDPEVRQSKPTLRAIADYLGIDDPCCMICFGRPVERAHARPAALEGSNDVRNFALLCPDHHRQAPDVQDSNSFWQWVDWKLSTDGFFARRTKPVGVARETEFFTQVREELTELYGWRTKDIQSVPWGDLMTAYYRIMTTDTSEHFGVKRKVATHAWALHRALCEITGTSPGDEGPLPVW
jgi:hypothetical protein